jgi:hypothetical protein
MYTQGYNRAPVPEPSGDRQRVEARGDQGRRRGCVSGCESLHQATRASASAATNLDLDPLAFDGTEDECPRLRFALS